PTQMSESAELATASRGDVVALSRRATTTSARSSVRPGSTTGDAPALIMSTFSLLTSTPTISCPALAKQAAVTQPTYPIPKMLTRMMSLPARHSDSRVLADSRRTLANSDGPGAKGPRAFAVIGDDHLAEDPGALAKGQRAALDPDLALSDGTQHRFDRRRSLDQRIGRPELPDDVAVRRPEERQAGFLGQTDRWAVEVDPPRIEMAEFDRVEEVDLLDKTVPETDGARKERVGRRHQPLRATEPAQVGEGFDPFEGNVDVVEEDVFALDGRLDPGDQQDIPLPGIVLQACTEGDGVVIGDAEDVKAG